MFTNPFILLIICLQKGHFLNFNLMTVQPDATYSVYYISVGSSTCFGCWHPPSGARTTVITASGINRIYHHPLSLSSNSTMRAVGRIYLIIWQHVSQTLKKKNVNLLCYIVYINIHLCPLLRGTVRCQLLHHTYKHDRVINNIPTAMLMKMMKRQEGNTLQQMVRK